MSFDMQGLWTRLEPATPHGLIVEHMFRLLFHCRRGPTYEAIRTRASPVTMVAEVADASETT